MNHIWVRHEKGYTAWAHLRHLNVTVYGRITFLPAAGQPGLSKNSLLVQAELTGPGQALISGEDLESFSTQSGLDTADAWFESQLQVLRDCQPI